MQMQDRTTYEGGDDGNKGMRKAGDHDLGNYGDVGFGGAGEVIPKWARGRLSSKTAHVQLERVYRHGLCNQSQ